MKKSEKIDDAIRPVLEAFLICEDYQATFWDMARAVKYEGDDATEMRTALFTVSPDGQIGFVIAELNDLFFEFQLIEKVKGLEPFKTLLETKPEKRKDIVGLAKQILTGVEINNEDVQKLLEE